MIRIHRGVIAAAALVGFVSSAAIANPAASNSVDGVYDPTDEYTALWTRADALEIELDETNTKPTIPEDFPVMTEDVWIWDTWPLTDLDMKPVTYKGWHVIFSLTAPRDIFFGDRHWEAKIGYFYSRDGEDWTYGGEFMPDSPYGTQEWAGSAIITGGNRIQSFYTASGFDDSLPPEDEDLRGVPQRLAHSSGTIHADRNGVSFRGFDDHTIIAEPDGDWYQTQRQANEGPMDHAFRDPFVFRDPNDGEIYALFEGNVGGDAGTHTCEPEHIGDVPDDHEVPDDAIYYNGNIGLLKMTDKKFKEWDMLPPLLAAQCVNREVERPHLVIEDGTYYLWTISHEFTFAPGLWGPDGVYGWVGDGLRSEYQPLNESAFVLGNPREAPLQAYSDYVMPNWLIESFIDTVPTSDGGVRYGGTLAPTLEIEVDGDETRLVRQWGYGYIPAMRHIRGRN